MKLKSTTKKTFDSHKNVDRRFLWWCVAKKLKGKVDRQKSLNIISFLLDILLDDLKVGSIITIGNFCSLKLKKLSERRHMDIHSKKYVISSGQKSLRINLDKKLSRTLIECLDTEATFKEKCEKYERYEQEIFGKD